MTVGMYPISGRGKTHLPETRLEPLDVLGLPHRDKGSVVGRDEEDGAVVGEVFGFVHRGELGKSRDRAEFVDWEAARGMRCFLSKN